MLPSDVASHNGARQRQDDMVAYLAKLKNDAHVGPRAHDHKAEKKPHNEIEDAVKIAQRSVKAAAEADAEINILWSSWIACSLMESTVLSIFVMLARWLLGHGGVGAVISAVAMVATLHLIPDEVLVLVGTSLHRHQKIWSFITLVVSAVLTLTLTIGFAQSKHISVFLFSPVASFFVTKGSNRLLMLLLWLSEGFLRTRLQRNPSNLGEGVKTAGFEILGLICLIYKFLQYLRGESATQLLKLKTPMSVDLQSCIDESTLLLLFESDDTPKWKILKSIFAHWKSKQNPAVVSSPLSLRVTSDVKICCLGIKLAQTQSPTNYGGIQFRVLLFKLCERLLRLTNHAGLPRNSLCMVPRRSYAHLVTLPSFQAICLSQTILLLQKLELLLEAKHVLSKRSLREGLTMQTIDASELSNVIGSLVRLLPKLAENGSIASVIARLEDRPRVGASETTSWSLSFIASAVEALAYFQSNEEQKLKCLSHILADVLSIEDNYHITSHRLIEFSEATSDAFAETFPEVVRTVKTQQQFVPRVTTLHIPKTCGSLSQSDATPFASNTKPSTINGDGEILDVQIAKKQVLDQLHKLAIKFETGSNECTHIIEALRSRGF